MYVGSDFPDTTPSEQRRFTFDFSDALSTGELISSAVWTIDNADNTDVIDPLATTRLVGGITNSTPFSIQAATNLQPGVRYVLRCVITTSQSAKNEFHSHVLCKAAG